MGDKIKIDYCEVCKMVLNRDEAISQAAKIVKIRKKKFFFTTLDRISIASRRFYEISAEEEEKIIKGFKANNNNKTMAQTFRSLVGAGNKDTYEIAAQESALVTATGSK